MTYADPKLSIDGNQEDGWMFSVDVDGMKRRQYFTLTVNNLMVGSLLEERDERYADVEDMMDKVQINVLSDQYDDAADRADAILVDDDEDDALNAHSPEDFEPHVTLEDGGSDAQPTIKVDRMTLGTVTLKPTEVTAGSNRDFTIAYTVTKALIEDDIIEVRLPAGWDADPSTETVDPPRAYQFTDETVPEEDAEGNAVKGAYVVLSKFGSRLDDTEIRVLEDSDSGDQGLGCSN